MGLTSSDNLQTFLAVMSTCVSEACVVLLTVREKPRTKVGALYSSGHHVMVNDR